MPPWNSVKVLGDDSRLRFGRVVDVADVGHLIDLCSNRRRELVPFDRVFLSSQSRCLDAEKLDAAYRRFGQLLPVEILVRESACEPWSWFPGEIFSLVRSIHYSWYSEVVVRWRQNIEQSDVVPLSRIRLRLPANWWTTGATNDEYGKLPKRVTKYTLGKLYLRLPGYSSPGAVAAALEQRKIDAECFDSRAVGVAVVDGCLQYIQRRPKKKSRTASKIVELHRFHKRLNYYISWIPVSTSYIATADEGEVAALPTELFTEVFSFLDTVTQMKTRIVCATWNAILESPVLTANLVLVTTVFNTSCRLFFSLLAPLLKRLLSSTKRIILTDRGKVLEGNHIIKVLDMRT